MHRRTSPPRVGTYTRRKLDIADKRSQEPQPQSGAFAGSCNPQELYETVWSLPTREVAKHYGFSDVRLGRVGKILQAPKPGRGYWAKKEAGRPTPKRPPLPSLEKLKAGSPTRGQNMYIVPAWSEDSGSPASDPNSNASLGVAQEWASQASLDIKLRSERLGSRNKSRTKSKCVIWRCLGAKNHSLFSPQLY
jgi:hypothetical protein